jgi:hypothetical protein
VADTFEDCTDFDPRADDARPVDETQACPECGDPMTKEHGAIGEPVMNALRTDRTIRRVVRPAIFWSCFTCGHCEEVGR